MKARKAAQSGSLSQTEKRIEFEKENINRLTMTAIPKEVQQLIEAKRDIPYQILSRIIEEGQKDGTIIEGDPDQLAILFWTSINGLAIFKATREDRPPMPEANLLIKLFLKND